MTMVGCLTIESESAITATCARRDRLGAIAACASHAYLKRISMKNPEAAKVLVAATIHGAGGEGELDPLQKDELP